MMLSSGLVAARWGVRRHWETAGSLVQCLALLDSLCDVRSHILFTRWHFIIETHAFVYVDISARASDLDVTLDGRSASSHSAMPSLISLSLSKIIRSHAMDPAKHHVWLRTALGARLQKARSCTSDPLRTH